MGRNEGREFSKILHSKLKTNRWPTVSMILEKIHFYIPKIPMVQVVLFRENNLNTFEDEEDFQDNFENMYIQLKTDYSST